MSRIGLPRLAEALLRIAVPREWRTAVLTDLEEVYEQKAAVRPWVARL